MTNNERQCDTFRRFRMKLTSDMDQELTRIYDAAALSDLDELVRLTERFTTLISLLERVEHFIRLRSDSGNDWHVEKTHLTTTPK